MEMVFSVPVVQQTMMILMMSFSRSSVCFSVCLRVHKNAPQNTYKITCPRVKDCRTAVFPTSANDIAPQMEMVMYGPASLHSTADSTWLY